MIILEDEGLQNETEKKTVADIEETPKSFVPTVLKLKYEYASGMVSIYKLY